MLFIELERAEFREVACDCVPSLLESSPDDLCFSSKLETVRIVEFMRFGNWGERETVDADGCDEVWPLTPLVGVRGMTGFAEPSEAGVSVVWNEGRSCDGLAALLSGDFGEEGGSAGGADAVTAVTAGTVDVDAAEEDSFERKLLLALWLVPGLLQLPSRLYTKVRNGSLTHPGPFCLGLVCAFRAPRYLFQGPAGCRTGRKSRAAGKGEGREKDILRSSCWGVDVEKKECGRALSSLFRISPCDKVSLNRTRS